MPMLSLLKLAATTKKNHKMNGVTGGHRVSGGVEGFIRMSSCKEQKNYNFSCFIEGLNQKYLQCTPRSRIKKYLQSKVLLSKDN